MNPAEIFHKKIQREIEQRVRMLRKERERNGKNALALVLKYPEVRKLHDKQK
jgi:hypothetical protein